jgi:hypothetical protein
MRPPSPSWDVGEVGYCLWPAVAQVGRVARAGSASTPSKVTCWLVRHAGVVRVERARRVASLAFWCDCDASANVPCSVATA